MEKTSKKKKKIELMGSKTVKRKDNAKRILSVVQYMLQNCFIAVSIVNSLLSI